MSPCILIFILCTYAVTADGNYIRNADNQNRIPGKYLIVLHPSPLNQAKLTYVDNFIHKTAQVSEETKVLERFDAFTSPILHIEATQADAMKMLEMPEVKVIESNLREKMIQQCASQQSGRDLWGLSRISARDKPDYETATYNYDQSGGDTTRVYILDTGIRVTHNDFGGRAVYGTNVVEPGVDPTDGNGHGTHCAGIAVGTEFGVSKTSTVVAVKTLTDGGFGSTSQIIAGINWAMEDTAERGIRGVLSMSIGGSRNEALNSAVESAIAAGIPVVAAAGNSNADACLFSPGGAEGVITVAGTDINDILASSTNWGPCVDILAPSREIRSASHMNDFDSRVLSGSSMATAFVAGQVVNYLAINPEATPAEVTAYLQETATEGVIEIGGADVLNLLLYASCE